MGAGVTAVTAQEVPIYLLNRAPISKAEKALDSAVNAARSNSIRRNVTVGTFEEDLPKYLGEADLIYESLAEDLELKRRIFETVDRYRRPDSIVATGSSGLSVAELAQGRSKGFRTHFLGLHFYNPPTRLTATEIIPGPDTSKEITSYIAPLMERTFRRVVLFAADRPGYAGNRIGFKFLNEAAQLAAEHGAELVDYLFGSYTGRLQGPLATIDLVGWDVHKAIVENIYAKTSDEAHDSFRLPGYMTKLIAEGRLGDKTPGKGGFFKREGSKTLALNTRTGHYEEMRSPRLSFVEKAKELLRVGRYEAALRAILDGSDEVAIVRQGLLGYISYAGLRNGEVSDMKGINRVMGWGFNWMPPDAFADIVGIETTRRLLEKEGLPVPRHLASHKNGKLYTEIDDVARYLSAR